MLRYLSDEWLAAAADLFARITLDPPVAAPGLTVTTSVGEVPGSDDDPVEYHITLVDDRITLSTGEPAGAEAGGPERPVVRLTQRFRTAEAVARGTLSAQSAFMSGDIQLGGDVSALIAHASLVARIGDALQPLRAETRFSAVEPL